MRRFRKSVALLAVFALAIGVLAGCAPKSGNGGTTGTTGPVKGGTLSFYIGEPAFIDPVNGQESEGIQVINAVFDSLVDFDPLTSEIKPAVAETWTPNADASVWTFTLRKGTKFHNGREVKAADFKYAWERIINPANKSDISYHLAPVKGYEEMLAGATELSGVVAKDDYTLEVTLSYPFADFQYVVGHPSLAPVPKEEVEKDPAAFLEMPVGNGPFKLTEPWKHQQFIKVARFDDYYGEKSLVDGVDFKVFKDDESAFLAFKQGGLDFGTIPTGQIKDTIEAYGESPDGYTMNPGKSVLLGSELSTYYVWLNTKDSVVKNKALRQALSLAIDRQAICDAVYEGTRLPASGPVPAGIVGYQPNAWEFNKYDVELAKSKLAEAGYPNGEGLPEIALSFNTGRGHEGVMQLIQGDLAKIGVKTKLDGRPWETYTSEWLKTDKGKFANKDPHQMMRLGWLADYPIMDNFLFPMFDSKSGDNKGLYSDPEVDAMLLEARRTIDDDARIKLYQDLEKKIGEAQPLIAVVNYRHIRVGGKRLNNLVFSPMGLAALDKAWLSAAK